MGRAIDIVGWLWLAAVIASCTVNGEGQNGGVCPPDALRICTCQDGSSGLQRCAPDGSGFSSCVCAGDQGADAAYDLGDGPDQDAGQLPDAVGDAATDVFSEGGRDTGEESQEDAVSVCIDPVEDCTGDLPAPTCSRGLLSRWHWDCFRDECVAAESTEICHFGCAPPDRGATCARLAYTDLYSDRLCWISSLDQEPTCLQGGGFSMAWHPTNAGLLAYTRQTDGGQVAIAGLQTDPPQILCQVETVEVAGYQPQVQNGSWLSGSDRLLMMEELEMGSLSVSQWLYSPYGPVCLLPRQSMCPLAVASTEPATPLRFQASYNRDRSLLYLLAGIQDEGGANMQVRKITNDTTQDDLCGSVLFDASQVTTAGWKAKEELLYVQAGSLFVYSAVRNSASPLVDASTAWSDNSSDIANFNYDATILLAYHPANDRYLVFRLQPEGQSLEPWPTPGGNMLGPNVANPSIERFEPSP
ncbi:MAG: hypothetical protein JW797_10580 [Bradymonadales bacterium]|nr:hypothetical protein [Bradymonadales bacterium]